MADNEVVIKVKQEGEGTALRDAAAQERELRAEMAKPLPKRREQEAELKNLNRASAAYEAAGKTTEASTARADARQLQARMMQEDRAALQATRTQAAFLRTNGDTEGADSLTKQAAVLERRMKLQRGTGLSTDEAHGMATVQIESERKVAETKAAAAAKEKSEREDQRRSAAQESAQEKLNRQLVGEEAKKQHAEERKVTSEHRERVKLTEQEHRQKQALAKAQESKQARIGRAALGLAENVTGGSQAGSFANVLAGGGIAGAIAAAISAATVGIVAGFQAHRDAVTMIDLQAGTASTVQSRKMARQGGFEGSAGGSREQAASYEDEITERVAKRREIEERSRFHWNKWSSWKDHFFGDAGNEGMENEKAIDLARKGKEQAQATQARKAKDEVLPQIEIAERQAAMDFKGARAVEDKLTRYREIQRLQREGVSLADAERGADAKVANIQRERAGSFARLISARDGARDSTRVAGLARDQRLAGAQYSDPAKSIDQLRADMNRNHAAATTAATRKDFTQRG